MSSPAREFLWVVEESAYKTPAVTPTTWTTGTSFGLANAQGYYCRLDQGNAFTVRPRPVQVSIPYGGGFATEAVRVSDKQEVKGKLSLILTVGQMPFWLSWAGVNISGGTSPWTTSEPNGDLASCAVYHAIQRSDGSYKRRVYLGTKVEGWDLMVSEESTDVRLNLDLVASTPQGNQFDSSTDPTSGTFAAPADNNFPIDPFVFVHAGGSNFITYGGAARTQFTELHISVRNRLARRFFANRYIQMLRFMGRKTSVSSKLWYPGSGQDDRTHYEGLSPETVSIELNNGTHGFTMGLNSQNIFDPFEDDLPLDDLYFQASTEANLWDATAGSDFTLTIA